MEAATTTVTIELEDGAADPQGRVRLRRGSPIAFNGWLQLLQALQQAVGQAQERRARGPLAAPREEQKSRTDTTPVIDTTHRGARRTTRR